MKKTIQNLEQERFNATPWVNANLKAAPKGSKIVEISNRMQYGRLYQFNYYDPKTRDKLAYYNTNPLVIKVGEVLSKEEGILDIGVNLNFFPEQVKMQFIDVYWNRYEMSYNATTRRETPTKDQKQVKFDYNGFEMNFQPYGVGFTLRRYILKRMTNIKVFANDKDTWAKAMLIKNPRFNGIGVSTRDKLFAEYINKTK